MKTIQVYSWKPSNTSNFGDEIGPMIVRKLCERFGFNLEIQPTTSKSRPKLLAVGSVLHEAHGTDVVWGVGVNSKNRLAFPRDSQIRFLSVRGPLTRSVVLDQGLHCPPVYGDPGLLFPMLFDRAIRQRRAEIEKSAAALGLQMPETIIIPNINDDRFLPYFASSEAEDGVMFISPAMSPFTVAAYISVAKRVISSSLHGLVFADAYGRSATRMISQYEPEFKYSDYYLGTGRDAPPAYATVRRALDGEEVAPLNWDPLPLLNAFPARNMEIFKPLIQNIFVVKPGQRYEVGDLTKVSTPFSDNWALPRNGSVWTTQIWNKVSFKVDGPVAPGAVLRMKVGTQANGKGSFELLRVVHQNKMIKSFQIKRKDPPGMLDCPLPDPDPSGLIELQFKVENASVPKDTSDSPDERLLGIWVSSFEITA